MRSPRDIFFNSHLEDGEEIQRVVHKHWFVIIYEILKVALLGFTIPFFIYYTFPGFFWLMILWMIVASVRFIYIAFDWYLDAWLLTNQAIIDVEWNGFFDRSAQRIEYTTIEQVSYSFKGFFQTIFRYGNLQVQQPGGDTEIQNIERPRIVSSEINKLREKYTSDQNFNDEEKLKDVLTGMVRRHIDKHGLKVNVQQEEEEEDEDEAEEHLGRIVF